MSSRRAAARTGDQTSHGGVVGGSGVATVLIGGQPAAVVGDVTRTSHSCPVPPQPPHAPGPFAGVTTVLIGGFPTLRDGDVAPCGATVIGGPSRVEIGAGA